LKIGGFGRGTKAAENGDAQGVKGEGKGMGMGFPSPLTSGVGRRIGSASGIRDLAPGRKR